MRAIALAFALIAMQTCAYGQDTPTDQAPTIFGVRLGSPMPYQECEWKAYTKTPMYLPSAQRCWQHMYGGDAGSPIKIDELIALKFPISETKDVGVIFGDLYLRIVDGNTEGASWQTYGPTAEVTLEKLKQKFGNPTKTGVLSLKNRAGATFNTISATWSGAALRVVFKGLDGTIDRGSVTVETGTLVARETERRRADAANATKL